MIKLKRKISVDVIIIAVEIHPFEEIRHHDIVTLRRSGSTVTVLWATILGREVNDLVLALDFSLVEHRIQSRSIHLLDLGGTLLVGVRSELLGGTIIVHICTVNACS